MAEALESCPRCGFQLSACSEILGNQAPTLDFLLDPGQVLPEETAAQLAPAYEKLQHKFPQISLSLCFVELNPPFKVNELAFWLINAAPDASDDRAWKIVLVFDVVKYEAGLASGYGIEPFVKETGWTTLLEETNAAAHQGDWASALSPMILGIIPLLEEAKSDAIARSKNAIHKH
jgi:hypothetical protein